VIKPVSCFGFQDFLRAETPDRQPGVEQEVVEVCGIDAGAERDRESEKGRSWGNR
jgi:hypothetical protein